MMRSHQIPGTDLKVSALAYGTADMGTKTSDEQGFALFDEYAKDGGNFIDTAHAYACWVPGQCGVSERFVRKYMVRADRKQFVIATKGGHCQFEGYPRPDNFLNPKLVAQDLNESLDRLGMSQVDIYYLHRDDPRVPVDEIVSFMNEHIDSGRIRYLGASNWSVRRLAAANQYAQEKGLQPFVILQNQWSLAKPDWGSLDEPGAVRFVLDEERAPLADMKMPVAAWSPTANGFFATDGQKGETYATEAGKRKLAAAQNVARQIGATPNQVALAYLMCQKTTVIPILGTGNPEHYQDALGSLQVELSDEQMAALDA